MNLFKEEIAVVGNLLPYDGEAYYHGQIMRKQSADDFLQALLQTIAWRHDEAIIFGRHIVTKRMVAWYGDDSYDYTYSNTTKRASVWTPVLLSLKEIVEARTGERFNSCLLNLYHNGQEGMTWHSDDEKELSQSASIASLSFGAERKFSFKHRQSKESRSLLLAHGSLLVMGGATQANWLHALPKMKKVSSPRVNLTFRKMNIGK